MTLVGKKGLVVGIANEHSIAWGCAKAFARFLLSDEARLVTGSIAFVDAGYNIMGN